MYHGLADDKKAMQDFSVHLNKQPLFLEIGLDNSTFGYMFILGCHVSSNSATRKNKLICIVFEIV